MGRWGDGEMGRWGDWEIGRLGDWEIGRLGDWEIGRLRVNIYNLYLDYTMPLIKIILKYNLF